MPTAIAIRRVDGKPGQVWYPLTEISLPPSLPNLNEVVIDLHAASLNHRDLFLRQHLYPGTTFGVPLLADGVGIVTATGDAPSAKKLLNKRVIINPGTGWKDSPDGPESPKGYAILGGTKFDPRGTLAECITVNADKVVEAPEHLNDIECAAIPLVGLTGYRAFVSKSGNAEAGRNILITGIGGGVALMVLQFAVAKGCNVYVSSGSEDKLARAKELGAKGGVNYKEDDWEKKLAGMLPKERPLLDAVIDGAGGNIVEKTVRIMKPGGVIVSYGMTVGPRMPFLMSAVLKNIDIRGSTMGSDKEFMDMVEFVRQKKLRPVISRVAHGLDIQTVDDLFEDMKKGRQFGKLVIVFKKDGEHSKL